MKRLLLLFTICMSTVSFGQYTSIPDPNFEQALIDLGHDDVLDGQVLTSNIQGIITLGISNKNISNLDGIEDFLSLENLWAQDNYITSLDLSSNTQLKNLNVESNYIVNSNVIYPTISSVNLPNSIEDITFGVSLAVSTINLSNCVNLKWMSAEDESFSELISLDFSDCYQLEGVNLNGGDVFPFSSLESVSFANCTQLLYIGLSNHPVLGCLDISDSDLLEYLYIDENPNLYCVEVSSSFVLPISWAIEAPTSIDVNCNYPTNCFATSNLTELNSNKPKKLIKIVNLIGQEVEYTPNTVLIYQYSDGTSEKVFTIED